MVYCRKLPIKKMKLETYFDVAKSLLDMFLAMANGCKAQSVYIVFDVYKESSIKNYKREVRSSGKVKIETTIVPGRQQKFPVLTEAFWACANNKAQLQNFFLLILLKTIIRAQDHYIYQVDVSMISMLATWL